MYQIIHCYDVDGGYGDAIEVRETLGYVKTKEEAIEYCKKYSRPVIYEKPYDELWEHILMIEKARELDTNRCPWGDDSDWDTISEKWGGDECYMTKNYREYNYDDEGEDDDDEED